MKYCQNCHYEFFDTEKFCAHCGQPLEKAEIQEVETISEMPKWKKKVLQIEVSIGIFLILCYGIIPYAIKQNDLNTFNEKTAQVKISEKFSSKRYRSTRKYRVYFEFKDGTKRGFKINKDYYEMIFEGETGTLYYKNRPDKNDLDNNLFIRFEKDNQ